MSTYDPFSDRSVIMPTPGGRTIIGTPPPARAGVAGAAPAPEPVATPTGLNPLLAAANPLLNMIPQLQASVEHRNPLGLRDELADQIRRFDQRARAAGIEEPAVNAARYVLCTVLDEVAATTPWGGQGVWARQSLLVMFFKEAQGGEKVFQLLARLADNPKGNLDLLELLYTCLAMGFEGRYRVARDGRAQLDSIRERLADLIRKNRPAAERELSAHWMGAQIRKHPVLSAIPIWVTPLICMVVLIGAFLAFQRSLNVRADPVYQGIHAIRAKTDPVRTAANATSPARVEAVRPRLAGFLKPEVDQGLVTVRDLADRSVVTIRGDGLFGPGSAQLSPQFEPLMARIADAVKGVEGNVTVTGHTDNIPISTLRFPSNFHLSNERARTVMSLIERRGVAAARLKAEGLGESDPIAANDTPANRARNRRVEVTVFLARADG